jgi:hypothetical protein
MFIKMKRAIIISFLISLSGLSATAVTFSSETSPVQGKGQDLFQSTAKTATLKVASRLFADKYDLTSVLFLIPADSIVTVLGSDSTYLHVAYLDAEGYIYKHDAVIDKNPVVVREDIQSQPPVPDNVQGEAYQDIRYTELVNKYGTAMADRLYEGKIWKGMNSEMVHDSWGTALKINRVISGNIIKEEWIYRNTWLYFENNTLKAWGPVNRQ